MWFPRVKIHITDNICNLFYQVGKWNLLIKYKNKNLYFRYLNNQDMEFLIDGYKTKEAAVKNGKILFYNVLLGGYYSINNYDMGDEAYCNKLFHSRNYTSLESFQKKELWFFNTKKYFSDFLGLSIYEADNIEDLQYYYNQFESVELAEEITKDLDILNYLKKNFDCECSYNEKVQKIFRLFRLLNKSDEDIQLLILCQILETMSINEKKTDKEVIVINDCIKLIKNSEIASNEKQSLISSMENLKLISSRKKIKNLLQEYCKKSYKSFNINELVLESYDLRGKIIHGEEIKDKNDLFLKVMYLKVVVLDTFKEWSKYDRERL